MRKLTGLKTFEIDANLEGKDLLERLEPLVEEGKSGSPVVAATGSVKKPEAEAKTWAQIRTADVRLGQEKVCSC